MSISSGRARSAYFGSRCLRSSNSARHLSARRVRAGAESRATTLAEVLIASAVVLIVGLAIGGLMLSYAEMARSTVLQERLNSRARRTLKNLTLDVRRSSGLALDDTGRLLTVVREDGGINEWEIADEELIFHRDGKEFGTEPARMLMGLAPTSSFALETTKDHRPLLHISLHLVESDRAHALQVLVIDTRVAGRGVERALNPYASGGAAGGTSAAAK